MKVTSYTNVTSCIYNTHWMKKIIHASLKPCQGKILWEKKKLAKEKEYSILISLRVLGSVTFDMVSSNLSDTSSIIFV